MSQQKSVPLSVYRPINRAVGPLCDGFQLLKMEWTKIDITISKRIFLKKIVCFSCTGTVYHQDGIQLNSCDLHLYPKCQRIFKHGFQFGQVLCDPHKKPLNKRKVIKLRECHYLFKWVKRRIFVAGKKMPVFTSNKDLIPLIHFFKKLTIYD